MAITNVSSIVPGSPTNSTSVALQLILETVGIFAFAIIGGLSNGAANVIIALLIALWLLALMKP